MTATIIIAIASAVISAVGGIVFREYQHRKQINSLKEVIEKKNVEIDTLKKKSAEYAKMLASTPTHNPGNIQL